MGWTRRTWLSLAAASGFVSICAGAFGAHGLVDPLAKDLMKTGATYEAIHALAIIGCAVFIEAGARRAAWAPAPFLTGSLLFAIIGCAVFIEAGARRAAWAPAPFLTGSLLFSGSLYGLALGGPSWLGVITPAGGLLLLTGWAVLTWACFAPGKAADSSRA